MLTKEGLLMISVARLNLYDSYMMSKREDEAFELSIDIISQDFNQLPKDKKEVNYEQAGSKIASKWDEYFGTLNLTPTLLQKLLSFMEDGISEDVIIEVMKISSKKAEGNPANYMISILRDYLNRSIYTIYDFKEEKQRMEEYEKRLQEINRKKERRDEKEALESDFEDRYR